ncbi:MAG TPA: ligase, partial [Odoribacter splanchnicus]|nr:ligase [Odoribacter splanchnicus]
VADAPLTGHGPDAFQAEYMDYQAGWLAEHPEEKWERLAGNVRHPFNEYLRIAAEYGVAGLLLVAG